MFSPSVFMLRISSILSISEYVTLIYDHIDTTIQQNDSTVEKFV